MKSKLLRNPKKPNMEIRVLMFANGIMQSELARELGLTKEWVCKLLSKPLSAEKAEQFKQAINEIINRG